jgi:hypothetical protein
MRAAHWRHPVCRQEADGGESESRLSPREALGCWLLIYCVYSSRSNLWENPELLITRIIVYVGSLICLEIYAESQDDTEENADILIVVLKESNDDLGL